MARVCRRGYGHLTASAADIPVMRPQTTAMATHVLRSSEVSGRPASESTKQSILPTDRCFLPLSKYETSGTLCPHGQSRGVMLTTLQFINSIISAPCHKGGRYP